MLPPLAPERARAIAAGLAGAHVLVVGDAMLDKFLAGRVTRISPEAPVPVVMFDHESLPDRRRRQRGAQCHGARRTRDARRCHGSGRARPPSLASACRDAGITPALIGDGARPTTTKMRIVTERNLQVARVDYEMDGEVSGEIEQRVVSAVQQYASDASAIVISDYLKGCVTARVARAAVAIAGRARYSAARRSQDSPCRLLRGGHHRYAEPSRGGARDQHAVRTDADARAAARAFLERSGCGAVLMTRGDQGMWLLGPDVEGALPASAREVADVTGAGDTVIATMALALAAGATLAEAARLANEAAGISVGKFGPAVVTPA